MAGDIPVAESLVVMQEEVGQRARAELPTAPAEQTPPHVLHRYGPRVAVVVDPSGREREDVDELAPGALLGAPEAVPAEETERLDLTGQLGVQALVLRRSKEYSNRKATRPRDGESWDAEGMDAPDARNPPAPLDPRANTDSPAGAGAMTTLEPPQTQAEEASAARAVITPPSATSGRLAGTIAVGIVIVDGPTPETRFSDAERVEVVAEVQNGLTWLGTQASGAPVTWSYEIRHVAVDVPPLPLVAVKCKHSGMVFDIAGASADNGAGLIQWGAHEGHNQHFSMEPLGDGTYRFVAEHSGKVLDVAGASTAAGAQIIQWDWHGGDNQRFRLEDQGNGETRIIAQHSGLSIDVTGASTAAGAQIIQWDWHGGDNQRFSLDTRGGEREARWRDPAVTALGHQGNWNGVHDYIEDLRRRLGTQWTYCCFFTKYPLGHFAYAFLGGPHIVMDYANDGWGPANIDRVFAHETGHIFNCPDEYASSACNCGGQWGYWRTPNGNCENCTPSGGTPCLMRANTWALCEWTTSHLGWTTPWALGTAMIAQHSGGALDVAGATGNNGAELIQWGWHDQLNQRFRFDALDDGHYRIAVQHSGKVLDVEGASTAAGARIIQWDWHGGDNQRFRLDPLPGGGVRLVAKHSGKVLDVEGASTAAGARIIQWDWHGENNQRFRLPGVPLVAAHSGKVLDVAGFSADNGAQLIQWDHHGGPNQIFRPDPLGNYQYRLVALHSGKVLDVAGISTADGAQIIQWDWHGGDNQRFRLEPALGDRVQVRAVHSGKVFDIAGASIDNGAAVIQWSSHGGAHQAFRGLGARIAAKHSGQVLDIEGFAANNGARLIQWGWHGGDNQRFRIEPLGDGTYRIVVEANGRVLDVAGASTDNGAQLIQWEWHGGSNQRFSLDPMSDGYYRVIPVHSGKVLDVAGASTTPGGSIIQWDWHGGDNQRFRL